MGSAKVQYGDFQTPPALARQVCRVLREVGVEARSVVEPTCGIGNFLAAASEAFPQAAGIGYDVNAGYARMATTALSAYGDRIAVRRNDFFQHDWTSEFSRLPEPILVVGNPPWVTNAAIGVVDGTNLPGKRNGDGLRGIEAITGKSNFDVSEWMLTALADALRGRDATIAMLVKEAVARKALARWWGSDVPIADARIYPIDAARSFGAAVAACLLLVRFHGESSHRECRIYADLDGDAPVRSLGYRDGRVVANIEAYDRRRHLGGTDRFRWRSGVKHDCAGVVELKLRDGRLTNGFGEIVEIEDTMLFPLLKGSDVANGRTGTAMRRLLVTQQRPNEDTSSIETVAPRTWDYLCRHREYFARRKSSIYRRRPDFAIFGVGEYTFAPYKVAIAALAKELAFRKISPAEKPVVFDDTVCFLPAASESDADLMLTLLESPASREFLASLIFRDSKRPITVEVLETLDLAALAAEAGRSDELAAVRAYCPETKQKNSRRHPSLFG
ncbi:MAG: hypothetical protein WBC44_02600 [Planctomycetaceae bacterium]